MENNFKNTLDSITIIKNYLEEISEKEKCNIHYTNLKFMIKHLIIIVEEAEWLTNNPVKK